MGFQKKLFLFLFLVMNFILPPTSRAEVITDTSSDTFVISLEGSELNNVSGLNVVVEAKDAKASLKKEVVFLGTGAFALLSSVTGPDANKYTFTVALNGMITNEKASLTGKFDGAIQNGAELIITQISRDGGIDITNALTKKITFSNSKATPTPTPTATPNASPSATPATTPTATPEEISEAAKDILDVYISENGEEINLTDLGIAIEEAIERGDESQDMITLTGPRAFYITPNKENSHNLRLKAFIKESNQSIENLALSCLFSISGDGSGFVRFPSGTVEFFNVSFKKAKVNRITKNIKLVSTASDSNAILEKLNSGENTLRLSTYCIPYDTEDPAIKAEAIAKGTTPKKLNYFGVTRALNFGNYILLLNDIRVNLLKK